MRFLDLTGQRFGRLVAISHYIEAKRTFWNCQCDCGTTTAVDRQSLRSGATTSCGCRRGAATAARNMTHGLRHVPEYSVWAMMRQRCNNPRFPAYKAYGGRGIVICERWSAFENFYADMGSRPSPKHELDRIDNDGPYSPDNCRWTTQQANANNKRSNRIIEHNGDALTLAEWSRRTGMKYDTLLARLDRGWPVERALSASVKSRPPTS